MPFLQSMLHVFLDLFIALLDFGTCGHWRPKEAKELVAKRKGTYLVGLHYGGIGKKLRQTVT